MCRFVSDAKEKPFTAKFRQFIWFLLENIDSFAKYGDDSA